MKQKLNFPSFNFNIKEDAETTFIWDLIRKKYVVLTPEEWVRQHIIKLLIEIKNYPKGLISLEKGLKFNKLQKRYDILVYDKDGKPFLLIECKEPEIKIDKKVLKQASLYNQTINAPYLCLSNGMQTFCFQIIDGTINQLSDFPIP